MAVIEHKSGLISGLAGITMLFAAFTSAYVVRRGISADWVSLRLPASVYASLLPLAGASAVLGVARRSASTSLLTAAVILGGLVCIMHLFAWRQFHGGGPGAAFFFVISAAFLLFVLGGVVGLLDLTLRRSRVTSMIAAHFYYWLYLSALWIYILVYFTFWN
jgi:cytochrome c oxidase subunit 3